MSKLRITNGRDEKNRKERKARYINLKNLMAKYPECSYGGDFYCNFCYDPEHPWSWVDFRFFHTKLKRYYAVALVTAEYEAYTGIENAALEQSAIMFPYPELEVSLHRLRSDNLNTMRDELRESIIAEELKKPIFVRPSIIVKDYGPVAIGLWATVNNKHLDEHVIREFISFFRSLGEPINAGWCWHGEEIQIDASRLFTGA